MMTPAILEPVQLDSGHWRIVNRCRECYAEILLDSEEKPDELACKIAALVRQCDRCQIREEARDERERNSADIHKRIVESTLPAAMHDFDFGDMRRDQGRDKAIDAVRLWSDQDFPGGVFIHGVVGAGKTRLAATAAWARLRKFPVAWVSVPVLIAQIGASFNDKMRAEAIKVLSGRQALVLDDLDKANPSEWVRNQLFTAIDSRVAANEALLVTTNLDPAGIEEKYGAPIASRLAGYCKVIELPGQDFRLELKL